MPTFGGRAVGAFSPGTISFDWVPDPEQVAQELMVAAGRLEDMSTPLRLSEQIAIADMRERFTTQTDPDGNPWVSWSRSYEPRARATNVGEILERTTALRGAATDPAAYWITEDSLFFSTAGLPEYGLFHQTGAERGSSANVEAEARGLMNVSPHLSFEQAKAEIQSESRIGGNVLPARPFIGPSFEAQLQIIEVFDQWFGGVINETFTRGGRTVAVKRGPGGRFTSTQKVF